MLQRQDYSGGGYGTSTNTNKKYGYTLDVSPKQPGKVSPTQQAKNQVVSTTKNQVVPTSNNNTSYYRATTTVAPSNNNNDFLDAYQSYVNEYKNMVSDYQKQLDSLAEENYKLQISQNENDASDLRNQANVNAKLTDRWLNQQYGGDLSGMGITNSLKNKTALNNTIANINNSLFNNNATASVNRYNVKSNNANNALSRYSAIDDSYLNYLKQIA